MAGTHNAPQSANEAILQNALGEENELRDPQSRIEELLLELLDVLGEGAPALKELNKNKRLTAWLGTTEEYEAVEDPVENCFYILTDELEIPENDGNYVLHVENGVASWVQLPQS